VASLFGWEIFDFVAFWGRPDVLQF
jgi:hypothetical protein